MSKTTVKRIPIKKAVTMAESEIKKTTAKVSKVADNVSKETKEKATDIVDEVKQELAKENAKASTAPKKSKFALSWGVLILVLVIIFGGMWLWRKIQLERIKAELPPVITNLGGGMELKELRDWKYRGGVWEFVIVFTMSGEDTEFTSYVSNDGKLLFTSGIDVAEMANTDPAATAAQSAEAAAATCDAVPKADEGHLDAYVVSQCPYGLQMQRAIANAITEAPELENMITVRYIGEIVNGKITAMHGDAEAQENMRQICIREEQPEKYWPYVSCYMKAGDSETCLTETGVNVAEMTACADTPDRGNAYAQADFDLANQHAVTGSPTMIVNNTSPVSESGFGGRSADGVKQMVCCGSNAPAAFCSQTLSTEQAAVSYSEQTTSAGGSTAGSC